MRITGQMFFEKSLARLAARGADLARIDTDDLWALAEAARRCADPFQEVNADAAGFPVKLCAGIWLWKLTIGASVWLDRAERVLGGSTGAYKAALVYALAHARDPEAFKGLEDERAIRRAVRGFLSTVCATPEEVNLAVDRVLGLADRAPDAEERASSGADWATLCARLEANTGIPATAWMWERSSAYAISAYNQLHAFARAYGASGRGSFEDLRDELDRANEALKRVEARILEKMENG